MHEGKELGKALTEAMAKKGVGPTELAGIFGVKPPSVSDWKARGCISKKHLPEVIQYFIDVVGIEHWGLTRQTASFIGISPKHTVQEETPQWIVEVSKIRQALDELETALIRLDMSGRERIAPLFESFARSPGRVIKQDITMLLEPSTDYKSYAAQKAALQKAG